MAYLKKSGPRTRSTYQASRGASAHPTERFQATCAQCSAVCEVPFKPNGKKPVYCRNCFKKDEAPASTVHGVSRSTGPSSSDDLTRQFDMLNFKLDRLIKAVEGRSRT